MRKHAYDMAKVTMIDVPLKRPA